MTVLEQGVRESRSMTPNIRILPAGYLVTVEATKAGGSPAGTSSFRRAEHSPQRAGRGATLFTEYG